MVNSAHSHSPSQPTPLEPPRDLAQAGEVRVLGPVEVVGPDGPAALVGARQRAVVGLLALNPGLVVPQWRLVDALWGDAPPRTAVKSLHSHVARVRQALERCGLPGVLATSEPGYRLALPPTATDVGRFEVDARQGREALVRGAAAVAVTRLRAALAAWRGDVALADADPRGWGDAEVGRLGRTRLAAAENRWEAELSLGNHEAAIGELERLLVTYPLRERLVELLMFALHRAGRHTDALTAYQRLRVRLADEYGVDPGRQLLELYTRILRGDPALPVAAVVQSATPEATTPEATTPPAVPTVSRPAQLPAPAGYFTGRRRPLSDLGQVLGGSVDQTRIALVAGLAGMGKTALAVHWAHQVADRFPDGQLFLDLRGHDPDSAIPSGDALSHLLRGIGVPADRVPAAPAERAGLYRSLLHDKQMLIVLDNAGSADAVLPLVPAGPGNLLLVTSRSRLPALVTHHAVTVIALEPLAQQEAVRLLSKVLGADRVAAEPAAAAQLVQLCARLPLALRIAAAKLAGLPGQSLRESATGLAREDRLDALSVEGGARSVAAVFASAYRSLAPPAALVFRRLGLHPGTTFTVDLAAALVDIPRDNAARAIAELVATHLVVDAGEGRFRFHDLTALYAQRCATVEESSLDRTELVARLVDWYVGIADAGNQIIDPGRDRIRPTPRHPRAQVPFAPDHQSALRYLDHERPNLLPVVRFATAYGHFVAACHLTYLLTGLYDSRGIGQDRIEMCSWAVTAAERIGDPATEGLMRSSLGMAYNATHRYEEALAALSEALPLMQAAGDRRGEGHVQNNIASAYIKLRRFDAAEVAIQQALAVHAANDNRLGIALAHHNLGHVQVRQGRTEQGLGHYREALRLCTELDSPRIEAAVLAGVGEAYGQRGHHAEALDFYHRALTVRRRIGDQRAEPDTLCDLGTAYLRCHNYPAALAHLEQALALSQTIGDPHAEAVARGHLARAHLATADLPAARTQLHLALAVRARVPDPYEQAQLHRSLSALAQRSDDPTGARQHLERAIGCYRSANAPEEAEALVAASAPPDSS